MKRTGVVQWMMVAIGRGAFAPQETATTVQWVEIAVISFGVVALSWWISPHDPTLAQHNFPWLWLAPVLIALRYGVMPGLLSGSLLVANVWLALHLGRLASDFSAAPLFGGGLLVLMCGEFSDVWRDRNKRMEETYLYVTERLSRLTKRHLLLNLSHDRLEQEMLARPGSLRDALARLRALSLDQSNQNESMPGSAGLLQLLSQYVNIESAQIYTLQPKGTSYALGKPVASLGEPVALQPDDQLLMLALEKESLVHIASQEVSLERPTSQLVIAPLVAGDNDLVGVLAVTRMPFFSLNLENLQMMLVMLGYFADNLRSAKGVVAIQQRVPGIPVLFAQELTRMISLHSKIGLTSHLVVMHFGGARHTEIPAEFLRIKRGLDLYWQTFVLDTPVIVILMPFATAAAKDGLLHRIEAWLADRFQGDFQSLKIRLDVIDFDSQDPLDALDNAVKRP